MLRGSDVATDCCQTPKPPRCTVVVCAHYSEERCGVIDLLVAVGSQGEQGLLIRSVLTAVWRERGSSGSRDSV